MNHPIIICDEMIGFFHYRRPDGVVRVGFPQWLNGKVVGRWAEVPEHWVKEWKGVVT